MSLCMICAYPLEPVEEAEFVAHDKCVFQQRIAELEEKVDDLEFEIAILRIESKREEEVVLSS